MGRLRRSRCRPRDDHARLQACLARVDADEAALNGCKGEVASACLDEWESATQTIAMCWTGEWNVWRAEMDAQLARHDASDPKHGAQLHASQEAWAAWVELECGYRAAAFGGGTGTEGARVRCTAGLTADRVISLLLE